MKGGPSVAYRILTGAQKDVLVRDGFFAGAPPDLADGYLHLSTADQLAATLDIHFAGRSDLWIAAIDLSCLGSAVKWEVSRGGQLFPHLHGPLEASAVIACRRVERDGNGSVCLP